MVRVHSVIATLLVVFFADGARMTKRKHRSPYSTCGVKGASAPSSQIVNGQPATECEWRWQAQLRNFLGAFCGGTLVTPEWVLTAAHCVTQPNFDVRFGDFNTSDNSGNEQTRRAVRVHRHPKYNDIPYAYDLAMVKLESPVTINECVGTACLPTPGADVAENSKCWITGWGTLRSGGLFPPRILQEAEVAIVSNDDCVNQFGYSPGQIDDSMICAQGQTEDGKIVDACQGDSGGPLVCESAGQWTVYGATSWGNGCAGANYPGVWARVHKELDWVQDILDGNEPIDSPPQDSCPAYCFLQLCIATACKEQCSFCSS